MSVNLPLDQITTQEKLEAMEALWADLTRNEKEFVASLARQGLQERDDKVKAGKKVS